MPQLKRPRFEELEARILYSADLLPGAPMLGAALVEQREAGASATPASPQAAAAESRGAQLVFVDSSVAHWDTLLADVQRQAPGAEVILIDEQGDGLAQVTQALAGRSGVAAIHLITHGADGQLQLGSTRLDRAALAAHAEELQRWQQALGVQADLLLYGCEVAQSDAGRAFAGQLAALTGADVAASTDKTGSAAAGGDWTLEYASGTVEAAALDDSAGAWAGVLQLSPATSDTLANTTTANTQQLTYLQGHQVAMDSSGNYVQVWEDSTTGYVYARKFNADGSAATGEFRVNTNTTAGYTKLNPAVAMDSSGNFVVSWTALTQDGSGWGIYAQRYNAAAAAQGSEFRVNTYTSSDQSQSAVAMSTTGFVVTWTSYGQDGSVEGIYAQRYNASGVAQGSEFRVNSTTSSVQFLPEVAMDSSGNFVIGWSSYAQDGSGYGVYIQRYNSAGVAQGGETQVNTTTSSDQYLGSLSMNASGNFVAAWYSYSQDGSFYGAYARTYDAAGNALSGEVQLNVYTSLGQLYPSVAMDAAGNFVASWSSDGQDGSGYGVYVRQFDLFGQPLSSETRVSDTLSNDQSFSSVATNGSSMVVAFSGNGSGDTAGVFHHRYSVNAFNADATVPKTGSETRANSTTANNQQTSTQGGRQVATDSAGNFALVWEDTTTGYVYGRIYNADGTAATAEFRVNTDITGGWTKTNPTVAMDSAGNFVVAWQSASQDGSGLGVYAQRYNAAGVAQGSEFRVNTATSSDQSDPAIAMYGSGFVISWSSLSQDASGWGVYAQRYNASGVAQGSEFRVNTYTANDQFRSDVAMDGSGNFVIAWTSWQDASGYGIYAQRYNASGVAQGSEFQVNTTTANAQTYPSVSMNASGAFVISWTSDGQDGSLDGIFARLYNSSGTATTGELMLNSTINSYQRFSSVAMDANGRFMASWTSYTQDGSAESVYMRQFDANGAAMNAETLASTTTSSNQFFSSLANNGTQTVVVWSGNGTGDGDGVFFQRFANALAPTSLMVSKGDFEGTAGSVQPAYRSFGSYDNFTLEATVTPQASITLQAQSNSGTAGQTGQRFAVYPDQGATIYGSASDAGIGLSVGTNGVSVYQHTDSITSALLTYSGSIGQDTRLAVVFTNKTPSLYINGTLVATGIQSTVTRLHPSAGAASGMGLGGGTNGSTTGYYSGYLSDYRIWDSALSAGQIATNAASGVPNHASGLLYQGLATSVTENASNGAVVALLRAYDASGTSNYTYSLSDNAGGRFAVSNTGQLTVANANLLNYEAAASHNITVVATGITGLSYSETITVYLSGVNEAPANTVPAAQSAARNAGKVFSTTNGNAISISDVDAGSSNAEMTLSVTNGTLSLATTAGLSFVTGDGVGDASMKFRGTTSAINTALDGLAFMPTANYSGGATLTLATKDAVLLSLDVDSGLLGRYAFENTGALGTDTSPAAGYTGTVTNGTATVDGTRGNVLGLTGTGGVQVTGRFGNPTSATLAAWVNLTASDTNGAEVISLGDNFMLRLDESGYMKAYLHTGSANFTTISYATTLAGTGWHHVAFSFSDANNVGVMYLDGVAVGTLQTTSSISYTIGANSFIGKHGNGNTNFDFNGRIDDARIYNRALNADEIRTLANDLAMTDTDTVAVTVAAANAAPTGVYTVPGVADANLLGAYSFNAPTDLGRDDAGGNLPITFSGSPGQVVGPDGNLALDLSGGQYGTVASMSTGGAMSFAASVRFDSTGDWQRVFDFGQADGGGIGNIYVSRHATSNDLAFYINQGGNFYAAFATGAITNGSWLHFVATVDAGGNMALYVNGSLAGSAVGVAPTTGVRSNHFIGKSNWAANAAFDGAIDNFVVMNGALSASQAAALYQQSTGFTVAENAANGTVLGTVVGRDADSAPPYSFSLSNSAGGRFAIGSSTGTITVANSSLLDYESAAGHSITVVVTDGSGLSTNKDYWVSLTDSNELPANTVPGAQTAARNAGKIFSTTNGNAISISDVDAGSSSDEVTLSVTNGTLSLATTAGLSFVSGDGVGDASMKFRGTTSAINTALNGLAFIPTANYSGGATLTLATKDALLLGLDVDSGLLGRYAFENTGALGTDSSPAAGNAGTVANGTASVDGTRGNVLGLAGTGSVQVTGRFGNPANLTLAAWVNLATPDTGGAEVISLGDNVLIRLDETGFLRAYVNIGSGYFAWAQYATSLAGTGWHHVAFSFSDTNNLGTLYLDGVAVGTLNTTASISYSLGANSFIGKQGNGSNAADFNGKIDDARIYNRALNADEIRTLANDLSMLDTDTVAVTVAATNAAPTDVYTVPGVTDANLLGAYSFNAPTDPGRDDAGGNLPITFTGSPGQVVGPDGSLALDLSGGQYGTLASMTTGGAMSFAASVRFDSTGNWERVFDFGQDTSGGIGNIYVGRDWQSSNLIFTVELNGSYTYRATATGAITNGTWLHFVATVDNSGNMALYVNGTLAGTQTGVAPTVGVRTNHYIGKSNWPDAGFDGAIDNFVVINGALSATQAAALYQQTANFSLAENSANGTVLATVVGRDADSAPPYSFNLSNDAGGRFAIGSSTGTITVANSSLLDYELATSHSITVVTTDGGGLSYSKTYTVNLSNASDAPTLTATGTTLAYTEGAGAVTVDAGLAAYDSDAANLAGATVSISSGFASSEDTLAFSNQNGITGSWNAGTGVLTLSGSASVANYQAALRSITYSNGSSNPSTATRVVSFTANDGSFTSAAVTRSISITAVNSAPVVGTTGTTLAYTENGAATAVDAALTVTDADNANLSSATVTISANFVTGEDVLAFSNQNGITGSWNAGTGVLSLSGSATVAQYQAALRSITYVNTSENPSTSTRTLSFVVNDGTANSNTGTRNISVAAANDAPVLSTTGTTLAYTENGAATAVDAALTVTDADNANLSGATVTISANFVTGEDLLAFSNQNGITGSWNAGTGVLSLSGTATVAQYQAALRSITYANGSDAPSTAQRTVSFVVSDGAANSISATRTIAVSAVNDLPTNVVATRFLSDQSPTAASMYSLTLDTGHVGNPLVLDGVAYSKGLGTHPASAGLGFGSVDYAIAGAATFKATIGINDHTTGSYGSVSFYVYVDGNLVYSIASLTSTSKPIDLNINVAGGSTLRLAVDNAGNSNAFDHGVWANARLEGGSVALATVAEGSASGTVVGSVVAVDSDSPENWSYSLFDSAGGRFAVNANTGQVSVANGSLLDFETASSQSIVVRATDTGGLFTDKTFVISLTNVNEAPVIANTGSVLAYTENGIAVAADAGLTVSDVDSGILASATITIATGFATAEDTLAFIDQSGITGSWNAATGVLSLSGSATVAQYQAALRSITYANTSDNPSTSTRTVSFVVSDGTATSNTGTRDISITAVNDAPVLSTTSSTLAYTENGAATAVDGALTVTDVDNPNLSSATVTISANFVTGEDVLAFSNQNGITGSWNAGTGVLSLSGTATVAQYQAAVRSITYVNTSENPSTSTRTLSFVVNDGTANSNTGTRNISVAAANDAPVLSTTGTTLAYTENGAATAVDAALTVTDADNANLSGATVTISANFVTGEDVLAFSNQNGITGSWNAGTGVLSLIGSATVAQYQTALRSITYENTSENPSTSTRTVSFVVNDGAANSNTGTRDISLSAVNDAPVLSTTGTALAYTENDAAAAVDAALTVSDADNANLASATVTISTNFATGEDVLAFSNQNGITGSWNAGTGVLSLSGTATVAQYQAAVRSITYVNTSENPSTSTRTLSFVVNDGTANSNTGTRNISVAAANDAPVLSTTGTTLAYTENGAATAVDAALTVTDADNANLSGATVTISANFVTGEDVLAFSNQNGITGSWNAGTGVLSLIGSATVAQYQTALRSITYENTSENPSTSTRTVSFVVNDGTTNSNTGTRDISLSAVNDAPVLSTTGTALAYTENDAAAAVDAALTVSDADNANLASATVTISTNFATGEDVLAFADQNGITGSWDGATGVLSLSGSATVAQYQAALRSITYANSSDNPSTSTRTVSFVVNDGAANSNTGTRDISLSAVNDAPVLSTTGTTLAYSENDAAAAVDAALTVSDADNANLASATVTISTNFATGEDVLAFADQNGITGSWDGATGVLSLSGSATVAQYQAALRSITYENTSENPSTSTRTVSFVVNDGAANSNTGTRNISVAAANDAPVLSTTGTTLAYTENGAATAVDAALTVTDADNANLASATVTISANFVTGEDVLAFSNQNGITGSWNAGTGVLSLSGTATVAQYQAAMRSITYVNTSENPSTSTRTVSFVVNDGAAASNTGTRDISLSAVNDAPVLNTTGTTLPYTENGAAAAVDSALTVTDADNANLSSATVTISTNFVTGEDVLAFADQNGITGSWDGATGVLSLSGSATVAQYQAALRSITYENTSENPSTSTRTVSFAVNDGAAASNTGTRDISLSAVNDAPVLSTTGTALAYTENGAATAVDAALTVNDADNANLSSATVSITTNFVTAEDVLAFTDQNGITGSWDGATGVLSLSGSATVTQYQAALRSITYANTSDNPSTSTRTVSFIVNDGAAASNTGTRDISLSAVNDAPVLSTTGTALAYTENGTATAVDAALTVTDADNANLSSATVTITTNFVTGEDVLAFTDQNGITGSWDGATGVLSLSGSATVAQYQAALRSITYENTSENPSTSTRTVSFAVNDGAAASNTGTRDISLSAVNDAPVLSTTGTTLAYTENGTATAVDAALTVTDADNANLSSATVTITTNFVTGEDVLAFADQNGITGSWDGATGVLSLSGSATVAQYQAALRSITYANSSDNPSTSTRTVSFVVNDGAAASNTGTRDISLSAVNDAPVLNTTGTTLSYTENDTATAVDPALTVTDADNANLSSATVTISANFVTGEDVLAFSNQNGITGSWNAATGVLSLSGSATVAQYQAALRSITYANTSDNPSTATRTVSFVVNDGAAASNTGTRDISLSAVNDAPVLSTTGTALAYTENGAATAVDAALTVNDADNANLSSATVAISTNFVTAEDVLAFTDQNGIAGSWDAATGVLSLSGSATVAQYQAALRSITYANSSDNPSTSTRTVSFVVNDDAAASNTGTRDISLSAVNDAPVLNTTGATLSYTENGAATAVDAALTVTDADNANLSSATVAISTNFLTGEDVLAFADQNGITGSWDGATGVLSLSGSATVTQYQAALRSITYANTSDNPSTATRTVSFIVNDGVANSYLGLRDIVVAAVNDAPSASGLGGNYSYTEDTVLNLGDMVVGDVDSSLLQVSLSLSDPTAGGLSSGTAGAATSSYDAATGVWAASGSVSDLNALLADLRFTPAANAHGSLQIAAQVSDGQLTIQGTKFLQGVGVNDAPVLASLGVLSVAEGSPGNLVTPAVLAATDLDQAAANLQFSLASVPSHGSLQLGSTTLGVGDSFSQADIDSGALSYRHDGSETRADGFDFLLSDGSSTPQAARLTIQVSAVNDETPIITSGGGGSRAQFSVNEGLAAVGLNTATDADLPAQTLVWSLQGGDSALLGIDPATGALRFVNAPDFENPLDADGDNRYELTLQVSDGQFSRTQQVTVVVTDVNEQPVGLPQDADAQPNQVAENATNGTLVGISVAANDSDGSLNTIHYSLSDSAQGRFVIDAGSGQVKVADGSRLDFEASPSHRITVVATSDDGSSSSRDFVISLLNLNDNTPQIVSDGGGDTAQRSVAEGSPVELLVTTVQATDADSLGPSSYRVSGGTDAARFRIDASSGELRFLSSPSYAQPTDANGDNIYELQLQASDGQNIRTQWLQVVVTDVQDGPRNSLPAQAVSIDEDLPVQLSWLQVADADGDLRGVQLQVQHGSLTLSLAEGVSIAAGANGSGSISLQGAQPALNATLASIRYQGDADYNGSDELRILSTDATGASDLDTVAIGIAPVNDAPVITTNVAAWVPGQTIVLGSTNIQASDVDNAAQSLAFEVEEVQNGHFAMAGAPSEPITSFSQSQLGSGQVLFVPDGSSKTPLFALRAKDGSNAGPVSWARMEKAASQAQVAVAVPEAQAAAAPAPAPAVAPAAATSAPVRENTGRAAAAELQPPAADNAVAAAPAAEQSAGTLVRIAAPVLQGVAAPAPPAAVLQNTAPRSTDGSTSDAVDELLAASLDGAVRRLSANLELISAELAAHAPLALSLEELRATQEEAEGSAALAAISSQRVELGGVALSVGLLFWLSRAGGLVASLVATAPAWRQLDPLPILGSGGAADPGLDDPDDDAADEAEEEAADRVLQGSA